MTLPNMLRNVTFVVASKPNIKSLLELCNHFRFLNGSRTRSRWTSSLGFLDLKRVMIPSLSSSMMKQFELNGQFMQNIMAQFPQQNQNGHHHQNAAVNLHDFTRLNPTVFLNTVQPMDDDDWLR